MQNYFVPLCSVHSNTKTKIENHNIEFFSTFSQQNPLILFQIGMTNVLSFLLGCIMFVFLKNWRFKNFWSFFFSSGPWPLRQPHEAAISTSATSIGYQILAEYFSFQWKWGRVRLHFPKWVDSTPRIFNWPKSPQALGLNKIIGAIFGRKISC